MSLEFVALPETDAESVVSSVAPCSRLHAAAPVHARRTFLDTADRRLLRSGLTLTHDVADGSESLTISRPGAQAVSIRVSSPPRWAADLPPVMPQVAELIDIRALVPLAEAEVESVVTAVLDDLDKTVARIAVEQVRVDGEVVTTRVEVRPLRGYEKPARQIARIFAAADALVPATDGVLQTLLLVSGRAELRGHGAPGAGLTRDQSADESFRLLLRHLLEAIEVNLDGTLSATDTEFLHDLRVAVRRTRTALKLGRGIIDDDVRADFADRFRWLGDVTTPARDLDVHLLEFPQLVELLPPDFAGALGPVHDYLERQHKLVRRALAKDLRSATFRRLVKEWSKRLDQPFAGPEADRPLGPVADARLRSAWRKALKRGSAIDDTSAPEALHDLRKRCKELRYALEFFGGLYDAKHAKGLVKELKALQDNLGSYQDSEVQRVTVEEWASALAAEGAPAATLVAIGRLAAGFDERQARARADFHETFERFARAENQRLAEGMVGAR